MALTESNSLEFGTPAPPFSLPNIDGNTVSNTDYQGQPLLVIFMCNHCPYVKHIAAELARIGRDYIPQGVAMIGIQSNDVDAYPDDAPDKMKEEAESQGYTFPYLYDETQQVALAYKAACTPDIFLFDKDHRLFYHGQLDETRPTRIRSGVYDSTGNEPHGKDLRAALDAMLTGKKLDNEQLPSIGCNIKWKPGNEQA